MGDVDIHKVITKLLRWFSVHLSTGYLGIKEKQRIGASVYRN